MSVVTRVKEIGTRSLISALLGTVLLGGTSVESATWSTQTNATSSTAAITLTPPDIGAGAVGMPQSTYSGASNTTVTDIACGSPCFAIDNGGMLQSCVRTTSKASSDPVWIRLLAG